MAVYQSATEPRVTVQTYVEVVPGALVESVGKRKIVRWMRRGPGIPAGVQPSERLVPGGWEFRFEWFQVETNVQG